MPYEDIKRFMNDAFPTRGTQILEQSMSEVGIINIDAVSRIKKKAMAEHIRKHYLVYSALKNRYIYQKLLLVLGLTVEEREKAEKEETFDDFDFSTIVDESLTSFWKKVETCYMEFGVILNVFFLKGIEAEQKGVSKETINHEIRKAFIVVNKRVKLAFTDLLFTLDLEKFQKKKKLSFFKFQVFEEKEKEKGEHPEGDTKHLLLIVASLKTEVENTFIGLEKSLLNSVERIVEIRSQGASELEFLQALEKHIIAVWEKLKKVYTLSKRDAMNIYKKN